MLKQWGSYKRQYVGLIEENEEKAILINYFYDNGSFLHWDEKLVFVFDGGSNFFNVKINLNKQECYDLSINDEA